MTDREQPGAEPVEDARPDGGYATAQEAASTGREWPRLRQVGTVAVTEYRLSMRSRWALALAGLFALFGAMLATFSGSAVGPDGMQRVVASLTSLAVYLVPLAALAFGYDAVVGRHEQGWLEVVFSLPVSRARVVVGTFLGRAVVLAGSTVVGFGVVGFLLLREFGAAHWGAFVAFLGGVVAVGGVFLAIALLVSTVAREKTHALGLALLVWVWFVLVFDLLAMGVVAAFELPDAALTGLVLLNPASVFRVLVLSQLGTTAGGGFAAALATTSLSPGLLVASLVGWTLGPLAAAAVLVRRRRL
ncbi:ABC transporter permease [Natronomonas salina]|uniref:ABC transporter permease n=1 Tax=Natronomonas salina TaxID=1710540 RepID=UPI0015B720C9|nr:ABC transporter permease [Natronomonas salina]QLD91059.1 ABC transporter permease [Natronomonas salina]